MVVIIKTPLQLICALEYLFHEKIAPENVKFVFLSKYDLSNTQISKTFAHFGITDYKTIRFINANIMMLFGKQVLLSKILVLKAFAKVKKLFADFFSEKKLYAEVASASVIILGDPNFKLYQKLIAKVSNKTIVLLDDGLSSMKLDFNYAINHNKVVSFSFLRKDSSINNVDISLENTFARLKSDVSGINTNKVLFIGQPLYEANLVSIADMNSLFKRIGALYNDKIICYIPHRWEYNIGKMSFPENFELMEQQDLPLELFINQMPEIPAEVLSFYSSALITLKKILPEKINFTALDIQSRIKLPAIKSAYEKIGSFNIKVIDFDNLTTTGS